jgi:hypothetical protein
MVGRLVEDELKMMVNSEVLFWHLPEDIEECQ